MTQTPSQSQAGAPPVRPGAIERPPRPPGWPMAIGVICLVLAGLGVLQYGCGTLLMPVGMMLGRQVMQTAQSSSAAVGAPDVEGSLRAAELMMPWQAAVQIFAFILSILLLVGGINLLRRRRGALPALRVWSLLKLAHAAAAATLQYVAMDLQMQSISMAGLPGLSQTFFGLRHVFGGFVAVVMLLFYAIWPVFLLIWLHRGRIRRQIAEWG